MRLPPYPMPTTTTRTTIGWCYSALFSYFPKIYLWARDREMGRAEAGECAGCGVLAM